MMERAPEALTPSTYGRLLEGILPQAAGYAMSILRNRADAEDAVQQAALKGLRRLSRYDARRPFKSWWFAVLRNCCIDLLRTRRPHVGLEHTDAPVGGAGDRAAWLDLAEGLDRLEPRKAEILRLRYFGGLTYEELSQALAIPQGTVMSRLHHARKALAVQMKDYAP
jgi:RNA polymerase sigma-70 factor (ECF subfamily)